MCVQYRSKKNALRFFYVELFLCKAIVELLTPYQTKHQKIQIRFILLHFFFSKFSFFSFFLLLLLFSTVPSSTGLPELNGNQTTIEQNEICKNIFMLWLYDNLGAVCMSRFHIYMEIAKDDMAKPKPEYSAVKHNQRPKYQLLSEWMWFWVYVRKRGNECAGCVKGASKQRAAI